jgi:hypothetical protein
MKIAPIYRAGKRAILSSMGKKYQPLIRPEWSKPLAQIGHLELPNLQTARGAHFGPINGVVSNLFDPTGPLPGITGFQVDILAHALSDLGAKRGRKHGLKSATRAAQWRRRWTVSGDASPGPAPFFGSKRRRFDKIGNFAEFQFSPPSFNFVQYYSLIDPETSDLMQFNPGVTSSSAPELRAFCNMVLGLGFMQFRP